MHLPAAYQPIAGDLHRHAGFEHAHPHRGWHEHSVSHHSDDHGHSHGLVDASIKRSKAGVKAVAQSLFVLAVTAALQTLVYFASGSVALLADLIHNFGDAATAIPLAVAFALRSATAERWAGLAVVAAILFSALVAGYEAIIRIFEPETPSNLLALAAAGVIGFTGNWIAAIIRTRAGKRIHSSALVADGNHARADAYVSLAVVASAAAIALGMPIVDPLIGIAISGLILKITLDSWRTVRSHDQDH